VNLELYHTGNIFVFVNRMIQIKWTVAEL